MSPLFAGRPPDLVRKCFGGKALRHFYVPFVGSTDASASLPPRLGVVGPKLARPLQGPAR
jgi:hypothetical protein